LKGCFEKMEWQAGKSRRGRGEGIKGHQHHIEGPLATRAARD